MMMVSRVAEIANKAATMADITNFISCDEIFLGYGLVGLLRLVQLHD